MIIGITGGIGSGKSTIAKELAKHGYTVFDCDKEAKRIIEENENVQTSIITILGEEAFKDGHYNTSYVAQKIFSPSPIGEGRGKASLLAQLNAIVHPAVAQDIISTKPDFVESAILYESGFDTLCDRIIVVDAPEEVRIARTINRDYQGQATTENISKVRARINTQKKHQGDLLIINDGNSPISELADKIIHWMWKN